jgi:hypothetical protein
MDANAQRLSVLEALFDAIADGRRAEGEGLLFRAPDEGRPWDVVTRVAAEGGVLEWRTVEPALHG